MNFVVQHIPTHPAGIRFCLVKTQIEIGISGDIIETYADNQFVTIYCKSRRHAMNERASLIAKSTEPIIGMSDFLYLSNDDVSEWLYESGRLIGIENHEAWFECLTKHEQSYFKIEYVTALKTASRLKQPISEPETHPV